MLTCKQIKAYALKIVNKEEDETLKGQQALSVLNMEESELMSHVEAWTVMEELFEI